MTAQAETPARTAFYRYIATHEPPKDANDIREMAEWMYAQGCKEVLRHSAELSGAVQALQRVLVLLNVIAEGEG
jgi:hypothetical protein